MSTENDSKYRLSIDDRTYGVEEQGYTKDPSHKYLEFEKDRLNGVISFIGEVLINYFGNHLNLTINQWKKENRLTSFSYLDAHGREHQTKEFNYLTLTDFIRKNGYFEPNEFNLPRYECFWLDFTIDARLEFHMYDGTGVAFVRDGVPKQQYGENFPIKPAIDREGFIITTFSPQLAKKINNRRIELVDNSDKIFNFDWLYGLKELINDTISLLDITLLQIYTKAEYNPLAKWRAFDLTVLGQKYSRRLNDKLRWVKQITGIDPNIEAQRQSISNLKEIRNHLNHFDPPTFAFTIEEAAEWLNQVLDVSFAICKIRKAIGVELSTDLINLSVQKKVKFVPESAFTKRTKFNKSQSGYRTSIWPDTPKTNVEEDTIKIDGRVFKLSEWVTIEEYAKINNYKDVIDVEDLINNGTIPKNKLYIFQKLNNLKLIKK